MNTDLIRPSTYLRMGEDLVVGSVAAVNKVRRAFSRAYGIEYRARVLAEAKDKLADYDARIAAMSPAERRAHARDIKAVELRVKQLRAKANA